MYTFGDKEKKAVRSVSNLPFLKLRLFLKSIPVPNLVSSNDYERSQIRFSKWDGRTPVSESLGMLANNGGS